MARISDIIAKFINDMIEEEKDKEIIIQRNELADKFNCAPSQINYVISTRFKPSQGYYVESKRGGGGYIKIKKVKLGIISSPQYLWKCIYCQVKIN